MKDLKRIFKIAGIIALVGGILSLVYLFLDLFYFEFDTTEVVFDGLEIVLSCATGIIFLIFTKKSKEYVLARKNLFVILTILNIFNGLITWAVSFWVEITVNKLVRQEYFVKHFGEKLGNGEGTNFDTNSKNDTKNEAQDENNIVLDESDYEVKRIKDGLTAKLEELENLRKQALITEEEYKKMRQETISNFMKSE